MIQKEISYNRNQNLNMDNDNNNNVIKYYTK